MADWTPQSRAEEILFKTINGDSYDGLPQSRIEELLLELKAVIESGGGGGGGTDNYNLLKNLPQINGQTVKGNMSGTSLGLVNMVMGKDLSTNDYTNTDKAIVDSVTTDLADKVDKITGKGLSTNDYTNADKAIVDGVTSALAGKANVGDIPTKTSDLTNDSGFITTLVNNLLNYYLKSETYSKAEVDTLIAAIATLDIQAVNTLPTTNISTTTIYLVPKQSLSSQDVKDEYINLDGTTSGWELIGNTQIDLSNYVTTSDLTTALQSYATKAYVDGLTFVGTQAQWNALTTEQKKAYKFADITDDYDDNPVGNLNALTTTDKSSCVGAINEVNTVITTSITELSVSGLTLTWLDNVPDAHKAIRVGNLVIVNVGLDIDGTFTGTTGWNFLFSYPDSLLNSGESFIKPYFTSMMCMDRTDNKIYPSLISGNQVWLDSAIGSYHLTVRGQMILPIVKS